MKRRSIEVRMKITEPNEERNWTVAMSAGEGKSSVTVEAEQLRLSEAIEVAWNGLKLEASFKMFSEENT